MLLKVCGLKYPENIKQVAALKPDFMGFIFYPQSKRFVGDDFLMPAISPEIKKVGVFVDETASKIIDKIDEYKLDLIQLHGNESPEFCEVFNHLIPVVKAFGIDESFDFEKLELYKNRCSYFLFDTKTKEHGGSGKTFDWTLLEKYIGTTPFFLSGGIGLDELEKVQSLPAEQAGSKFKVYGIDVNSKFEIEPGLKEIEKLKQVKHELSS